MTDQSRFRSRVVLLAAIVLTGSLRLALAESDDQPLHRKIDAIIDFEAGAGLSAKVCDDAAFLRRVSLDLAGTIPSSEVSRAFIADTTADKRTRLVDNMLASPKWASRMADLFHVVLMERRGDDADWRAWLEKSFAANKPWNQLVYQVLNADADDEENRAAAYFMSKRLDKYGQNPVDYPGLVRDIGRMFLGQDLQCAECHDHLFIDDYKQLDFQGLFAVYKNTFVRRDVKFPAVGEKAMTAPIEFVSVFDPTQRKTGPRIPGGSSFAIPEPKPLESPAPKKKQPIPPRPEWSAVELIAQELTRPENRQFARTAVNRIWYVLLGRGLVHPVDLDHSDNPPSHPRLLDLLTDEFIANGYDVKWLVREIVLSKTWQRSSHLSAGTDPPDPDRFLIAIERPLMAEQLLASVIQATEAAGSLKSETNTPTDPTSNAGKDSSDEPVLDDGSNAPTLAELKTAFTGAFANEAREPEGEFKATVKGALFWRNSVEVQKLLHRRPVNLIDRLMEIEQSDSLINELYLVVLSRFPSPDEAALMTSFVNASDTNRETAIRDAVWALLTSVEFFVNH